MEKIKYKVSKTKCVDYNGGVPIIFEPFYERKQKNKTHDEIAVFFEVENDIFPL